MDGEQARRWSGAEELARHPLFAGMPAEALSEALAGAEKLQVPRGQAIYRPGRFRRSLGLLLEGRVRVERDALDVSILRAGDLFGAAALFAEGGDYPTALTALSPCRLLLFPQAVVEGLLRGGGAFPVNYAAYLSGRVRFLSGRLDAVSASTAEDKVLRYLRSAGGGTDIPAARLSRRLGIARASLYRAFDSLEQAGAIARCGKHISLVEERKETSC